MSASNWFAGAFLLLACILFAFAVTILIMNVLVFPLMGLEDATGITDKIHEYKNRPPPGAWLGIASNCRGNPNWVWYTEEEYSKAVEENPESVHFEGACYRSVNREGEP